MERSGFWSRKVSERTTAEFVNRLAHHRTHLRHFPFDSVSIQLQIMRLFPDYRIHSDGPELELFAPFGRIPPGISGVSPCVNIA